MDPMQNPVLVEKLITSSRTGEWCRLSYPGHSKGCPNYGREGCPPKASPINEVLDLSRKVYIVYSEFNVEEHSRRMEAKHPTWSERQCRCVLYWQGMARKRLREEVSKVAGEDHIVLYCPEAHGVNVYATCKLAGITLEKIRSLKVSRHVALIGYSNPTHQDQP